MFLNTFPNAAILKKHSWVNVFFFFWRCGMGWAKLNPISSDVLHILDSSVETLHWRGKRMLFCPQISSFLWAAINDGSGGGICCLLSLRSNNFNWASLRGGHLLPLSSFLQVGPPFSNAVMVDENHIVGYWYKIVVIVTTMISINKYTRRVPARKNPPRCKRGSNCPVHASIPLHCPGCRFAKCLRNDKFWKGVQCFS